MKTELSLLCLSLLVWAAEGKIRVPGPGPGDPWSNRPNFYLPIINFLFILSNYFFKLRFKLDISFAGFQSCGLYPCKNGSPCKINLRGEAYCE